VDGVVLAVGPHLVPVIHPDLNPEIASRLNELPASTVFGMRVALNRPPDPGGTVIVSPYGALGGIGLITFDHNISPGSVPSGKGMLGVLLCHDWARARMSRSDDELVAEILPDLCCAVPDVAELIEFAHITRWNPAGLDGSVGTQVLTAEIASAIDPADRIRLAGEYLTIPGLEGSVVTANSAAQRLAEVVRA
jgi:protoporphyrinogen oxidase